MSVITSLNKRAANLAQKALRLGGDFVHPVSDDSGNTPDYNDPNNIISPDGHIDLPHTVEWGEGFPSTTFLDPETGLLTTKTEGKPPLDEGTTIYDIYADRAERMGDEPLYTYKTNGEWVTKTGNEVLADIRQIAKGLMHYGLKKGDGVAFMCRTSYEWDVFDAAVMACGGVLATIYDTDSAEQIRNIVNNSDSRLLVVETTDMRAKADGADKECPALEHIICFENGGLDEIMAYGSGVSDEELDGRIASIKKTDLCSIVYTSGSTAAPKGVEMTHEHYCTTALNLPAYMPKLLHERKNSVLLFLPQAHSFARAINYICVASELHIYIAQGIKTLIADLQVAKPSVMIVVPRVLEKVYNAASRKAGTGWKGRLFLKAAEAARDWSRMQQAGERPTAKQIAQHLSYEASVYRTVRSALGPRIRYVACGGAPLDVSLAHFFNGIGLPMIQGYGMTETAAPFAATRVTDNVIGTVGQPAPGSSVRISDDGELQVKGPNVFRGYHNLPEKTAEAFTEDGWLKTGDLASIDDEGRITITGRKKDIIITAGGKNVSPIPMEQEIVKCPIVEHVVVVGDNRPFIGALITLDPEGLEAWLPSIGLSADTPLDRVAATAAVHDEIQKYVDKANATVSRAESVRKFVVLDTQFTQENKCLTPSLKVVRPAVNRVFAQVIDQQLYSGKR